MFIFRRGIVQPPDHSEPTDGAGLSRLAVTVKTGEKLGSRDRSGTRGYAVGETRSQFGHGVPDTAATSGMSYNGAPLLMPMSGIPDLSDEVIAAVNKGSTKSKSSAASLVSSADLKFGYIDMNRAFKAMPEAQQAEQEINEQREKANAELANADSKTREAKEKELQATGVKKREGIMQKITENLRRVAEEGGFNLVFDSSGNSLNGVPVLVSTHDLPDLTDEVVTRAGGSSP